MMGSARDWGDHSVIPNTIAFLKIKITLNSKFFENHSNSSENDQNHALEHWGWAGRIHKREKEICRAGHDHAPSNPPQCIWYALKHISKLSKVTNWQAPCAKGILIILSAMDGLQDWKCTGGTAREVVWNRSRKPKTRGNRYHRLQPAQSIPLILFSRMIRIWYFEKQSVIRLFIKELEARREKYAPTKVVDPIKRIAADLNNRNTIHLGWFEDSR